MIFSLFRPLTSGLYQGRVHDLGRRTKDGSSSFHALLGGRWTADGGRLFSLFRPLTSPPLTSGLCQEPGREASERRTWAQRAGTALLLFPRTGPRSWTKDEGRLFSFSCSPPSALRPRSGTGRRRRLASRSDTGLRKQTGGGMSLHAKDVS